jgi:hypothetical protein
LSHRRITDRIDAVAAVEDVGGGAAADQRVVAVPAMDRVRAAAAVEDVVDG